MPKPSLFMFALVLPSFGSSASGSRPSCSSPSQSSEPSREHWKKIERAVAAMVGIGAEAWRVVRAVLVVAIVQLAIDAE